MSGIGIGVSVAFNNNLSSIIGAITATISGLTANPTYGSTAQIGTTLTAAISEGTISSRKWGSTLGGSEFGTGASPTDFSAADGALLHLEVVAGGITYNASATVREAPPTFSTPASLAANYDVGGTVAITEGVAGPSATLTITQLDLDGVDKLGELSGANWDTTGEDVYGAAGLIELEVTATNTGGSITSTDTSTLRDVPAQVTAFTLVGGDGEFDITAITAPDDGNSAITGYEYRVDGGSAVTAGALPDTISAASGSRGVEVRAVNAVGNGAWSTSQSVTVSGPALTLSITGQDATITSSELGTCYYGIYPAGTLIGAIDDADMVAGTDTAQIEDGTAGVFIAAGVLPDATIDTSSLTGGTDYVLAVVVDIDDGGTYTNLALDTFTAAATGATFVFEDGWVDNNTIAASTIATVATISLTGSGAVAGDLVALTVGTIGQNSDDFGVAPDDVLVNDVSVANLNHATGSDTPSTNRANASFATHVLSAGDITADELVIKLDTPPSSGGEIQRSGGNIIIYSNAQFDQFTSYMAGDVVEPLSNSITLAADAKVIQGYCVNASDSVAFDFAGGSTSMDATSDNVIVSDNGMHVQYDTTTNRAAGSFTATATDANTPHGTTFQAGFGASIKPL